MSAEDRELVELRRRHRVLEVNVEILKRGRRRVWGCSRSRCCGTHGDLPLRVAGFPNRIDPQQRRPLIMTFQRFFALGDEVHPSHLSSIDEGGTADRGRLTARPMRVAY